MANQCTPETTLPQVVDDFARFTAQQEQTIRLLDSLIAKLDKLQHQVDEMAADVALLSFEEFNRELDEAAADAGGG